MKKVLVDTENITNYEVLSDLKLSSRDEVIFFLSQRSKPLKPQQMHFLLSLKSKLSSKLFEVSKQNELDTYIGMHLASIFNAKYDFYIFSNDTDFELHKSYYKQQGFNNVHLLRTSEILYSSGFKDMIVGDISKINELELKRIFKNSSAMSCLHNKLVSQMGEEGKHLYKEYKKKYS